jgi:aryl-alcohol dehydrogenase-like predicted oxidoreductase
VIVATKFGIMCSSKPSAGGGSPITGINGRPEYVRAACDAPLKRLGVERIDFYYQHRVDAEAPIKETVGAMAELVAAEWSGPGSRCALRGDGPKAASSLNTTISTQG